MVRPRIEPANSSFSSPRISAGSRQLLVGPASCLAPGADEGAVLDPRHVAGIGAGQVGVGPLGSSESRSKVPASTSVAQSWSYSSWDPSHQWTAAGLVSSATRSTQSSRVVLLVAAVVAWLIGGASSPYRWTELSVTPSA